MKSKEEQTPEESGKWISAISYVPDPHQGIVMVAVMGEPDALGCKFERPPLLGKKLDDGIVTFGFYGPDEKWRVLCNNFLMSDDPDNGFKQLEPSYREPCDDGGEVMYWRPLPPYPVTEEAIIKL